MRVAYLTNQYPKISHTFIRREIRALEDQGVEVRRYSVRKSPDRLMDPADLEEAERTRVLLDSDSLGLVRSVLRRFIANPLSFARAARLAIGLGTRSDRGWPVHLAYLIEACRLADWCEQDQSEHVHVHFGTNPATVAMLCHVLGGPTYSMTVHGPEEFEKGPTIGLREKVERATFVCGVSHYGRDALKSYCDPALWSKLHVVRCGLDERFLNEQVKPLPAQPRLLFVGRLHPQKRPLVLLEAASRLKQEGVDFELVVVGDGEQRADAERYVAEHGLTDVVQLVGWGSEEQVLEWLNHSRFFVLPSLAEGLPVVIMEALALGRPTLSTAVAGIPELVEPGKTGWLVTPDDVESLVAGLRAALSSSDECLVAYGAEGRDRVLRQHDIRQNATQLRTLLHKAITGTAMAPETVDGVIPVPPPPNEPTPSGYSLPHEDAA